MTVAAALVPSLAHAAPAPEATVQSEMAERPRYNDFAGINPVGLAGFLRLNVGTFGLHYERIVGKHHGLWAGVGAVHVHQAAEHEQIHLWTFGGDVAYRFYLRPGEGTFFGLGGGYKAGFGKRGEDESPDRIDLAIRGWNISPQLGHRWVAQRVPLSFVARISLGYAPYHVSAKTPGPDADAARLFALDALSVVPLGVDAELSIAYAF